VYFSLKLARILFTLCLGVIWISFFLFQPSGWKLLPVRRASKGFLSATWRTSGLKTKKLFASENGACPRDATASGWHTLHKMALS
jgi:hypothetical protein